MYQNVIEDMISVAKEAMKIILKYYHDGFHVEIKNDNSPVTEADKASDKLIREFLKGKYPDYAFLTEESVDDKSRLKNDYVFIIDPLDGTEDYVHRDGEFTINIALSYKHEIVAGVVAIPVSGVIYYATKNGGAYKLYPDGKLEKIHVSDKVEDLTCLTSVYHANKQEQETIKKYSDRITHVIKKGSSLKACEIAEGKAEISYRLSSGTKEWDTAAFDIIVKEAGGYVLKLDKTPITYDREDVVNRDYYLVVNRLENFLI